MALGGGGVPDRKDQWEMTRGELTSGKCPIIHTHIPTYLHTYMHAYIHEVRDNI